MRRTRVLAGSAAVALALVLPASAAAAAEDDVPAEAAVTVDEVDALYVGGVSQSKTVTPAQVRGQSITAPAVRAQQLPVTGGDIAGLVLLGGAAIGTGAILVRRGRSASTN